MVFDVLPILFIALLLYGLPPLLLGIRLWRLHFVQPPCEYAAVEDVPPALHPIFHDAAEALAPLGFVYSHTLQEGRATAQARTPFFLQIFYQAETASYAEVCPALFPDGGLAFDVSFVTIYADGEVIATADGQAHREFPPPPWYHRHDQPSADLAQQWQAHQHTLAQHPASTPPLPCTPEQHVASRRRLLHDLYAPAEARGWLAPVAGTPYWRLRPLAALQWAWRIRTGDQRRATALRGRRTPQQAESPAYVAAHVAALARLLEETVLGQTGWQAKSLLFLGSLVVGTLTLGLQFSWQTALILVGVLLIHELGHWVGMWWFGYRDLQILLVPFLGAATWGRKDDATVLQQSVVLCLGPVPGLCLGLGCLWLASKTGVPLWYEIGGWALLVNYLNLLPIVPFDGGRLVEALWLRRWPLVRCGFVVLSALALGAMSWGTQDMVLGLLAVLSVSYGIQQWHWGRAAQRIAKALPPEADQSTRLQTIVHTILRAPLHSRAVQGRLAMAQQLYHQCALRPPALGITLLSALLYLLVVCSPVAVITAALWTESHYGLPVLLSVLQSLRSARPEPQIDWPARLQQATTPEARWQVLLEAGQDSAQTDDTATARQYLQQALTLAQSFGAHDLRVVDTLLALATLSDQPEETEQPLLQALAYVEAGYGRDHLRLADILESLAHIHADVADHAGAIGALERAVQIRTQHGATQPLPLAQVLTTLASSYEDAERVDAALQTWQHVIQLYERLPDAALMARAFPVQRLADLYTRSGQADTAQALLHTHLTQWRTGQNTETARILPDIAAQLGWIAVTQQDLAGAQRQFEEALVYIRASLQRAPKSLSPVLEAPLQLDLCYLQLQQGNLPAAQAHFQTFRTLLPYSQEVLQRRYHLSSPDIAGDTSAPAVAHEAWGLRRATAHQSTVRRMLAAP